MPYVTVCVRSELAAMPLSGKINIKRRWKKVGLWQRDPHHWLRAQLLAGRP